MFAKRLALWTILALSFRGAGATDDSGAWEAVVQTLSQKVTQLEARINADHNELQELKKLQPSVIFSVQNSNYKFPVTNQQTLIFDYVRMNRGGGYSARLGEFTAPVSGLYYVSYRGWSCVAHAGYLFLKQNAHSVSELPFGDEDHESASSQSLVLHLNQGDVLAVVAATSGTVDMMGGDRSSFMGYLIMAD